jgi:hypothetical protein
MVNVTVVRERAFKRADMGPEYVVAASDHFGGNLGKRFAQRSEMAAE